MGLREIAWDIHFGQQSVFALEIGSQALWPPVFTWLYL
jgi:hypothetical protein